MKLGMGMMRLPLLDENDFTSVDYDQVNEIAAYISIARIRRKGRQLNTPLIRSSGTQKFFAAKIIGQI